MFTKLLWMPDLAEQANTLQYVKIKYVGRLHTDITKEIFFVHLYRDGCNFCAKLCQVY